MNAQAELFEPVEPKKFTLRKYQTEAIDSVEESFKENASALMVLPTGCGKTIAFAELIKRFHPHRAIVLGHREEIIFQAKNKIEDYTGFTVHIEMGMYRTYESWIESTNVIVSTVQTQISGERIQKFDPANFGLLILDEAHHCVSDSWRRVINHYKQNPRLKILGVTATPDRADEKALGKIFDTVAYDYEILDAINDGWLVPIEQQMIEVEGLDFSQVRTTAGDLNGADLAEIMEFEKNLHGIADPIVKTVGEKRTLVFAASVKQAERLSEIFNRHKPNSSSWVCGKTPKDERRKILYDFAHGKQQFMVNVGVLTEGWDDAAYDEKGVQVIAIARPTKSRALYAQMIGRGLRPLAGTVDGHELDSPENRKLSVLNSNKKSCLVLDFVGNSGRHKLMTTCDILGGNYDDDVIDRAEQKARKSGEAVRVDEFLKQSLEEIEEEKRQKKLAEEAKRNRLVAKANFSSKTVDPFNVFELTPQRDRGWHEGKTLSEKQRDTLLRQGINPDEMNYAASKQLLVEIFRRFDNGLCSYKQARLLKKHGYTGNETRAEATKIIGELAAKQGWRKK